MQRSTFFFACARVALSACATAADDGTSPGGATHDSGTKAGADSGVAPDTRVAADDTSTSSSDTGAPGDDASTSIDSGSVVEDAGAADAPSDPSCAAAASNNDCQTCCYTAHTDAYNAFADALTSCACKPGNCDTSCAATACASPPAASDATCIACLKSVQTGACKSDIDAVCASPTGACYPFARCVITSGCNSKP